MYVEDVECVPWASRTPGKVPDQARLSRASPPGWRLPVARLTVCIHRPGRRREAPCLELQPGAGGGTGAALQ
eukprot:scaffold18161_cov61-Phaeocystis_antarctica.AAC.2